MVPWSVKVMMGRERERERERERRQVPEIGEGMSEELQGVEGTSWAEEKCRRFRNIILHVSS